MVNRSSRKLYVAPAKRILLVSSGGLNDIAERLRARGYEVIKVNEGMAALTRVRREHFDAVILFSTGPKMDLTETALNLRDVNPTIRIFVLADPNGVEQTPIPKRCIARIIPQASFLTMNELMLSFTTENVEQGK